MKMTEDKQFFIFPCNPNQYDCIKCFENTENVDWRQNINNCNVGDIVYIYISKPYSQIRYKTVIEKTNIPFNDSNKEDFKYYTDPGFIPTDPEKRFVRLNLLEDYGNDGLSLKQLKEFGLKYNIQGQGKIDTEIERKIEIFLNVLEEETSVPRTTIVQNDVEGKKKSYWTTTYERSPLNRKKCI